VGRQEEKMRGIVAALVLIVLVAASDATAQARIEKNVVYGMYSGLALLMDPGTDRSS
jgi:hypothetical protein